MANYFAANKLYENDGNLNFTDVSASKGIVTSPDPSCGATFGDLNEDGFLDIYVSNYVERNALYLYNPQTQTYQNIASTSGTENGVQASFCSSFFDFDNDGDLDIYVANDRSLYQNAMYMNMGNMSFVDVSVPTTTNLAVFAMSTAIGDYNNDQEFDIFITDIGNSHLLENQIGTNLFENVSIATNTRINAINWGANFFDFDNDFDEDLYVSNANNNYNFPNVLCVNNGAGGFDRPLDLSGGLAGIDTMGAYINAILDFNNDGKQDIAVSGTTNTGFFLFSNHHNTDNNFIKLDLTGVNCNRDAYGSLIELSMGSTTKHIMTHSTNGYLNQNSDIITIGLGTSTYIDQITIDWGLTGYQDVISGQDLTINAINYITQGTGVTGSKGTNLCLYLNEVEIDPIPDQCYGSVIQTKSSSLIESGHDVKFTSQQEVLLEQEFEVKSGAVFHAFIDTCNN